MSLASQLSTVVTRIATEFKTIRTEISGGSSSSNIDGGQPNTNYGGTTPVDGGAP